MLDPRPVAEGGTLNYPALTIEAKQNRPVRVKWINGLVDANGNYLPHLFAVDQTLHWANPAGGPGGTDSHGMDGDALHRAVPIVTHVHGAHTTEDSDGYPEAWYLPAANNIPAGYATGGSFYEQFKQEAEAMQGQTWQPGSAVFQYPNDQRPTTLWYHDHALGMTRLNVYAGPAGFYLLRKDGDKVAAKLPKPAPQRGDKPGTKYREIPIAIQDRSFNADGSLFYPDNRAFFEGLNVPGQSAAVPRRPRAAHPVHARHGAGRPDERHLAAVEPGVLRQHHGRERQDVAVPERRAAALPLPAAERHPVPVPHPQDEQRHAHHADRQRGRLPAASRSSSGSC